MTEFKKITGRIINVDSQENFKTGGKKIQNYDGIIYKEIFKTSLFENFDDKRVQIEMENKVML